MRGYRWSERCRWTSAETGVKHALLHRAARLRNRFGSSAWISNVLPEGLQIEGSQELAPPCQHDASLFISKWTDFLAGDQTLQLGARVGEPLAAPPALVQLDGAVTVNSFWGAGRRSWSLV